MSGAVSAPVYPAMREWLRQCVAEAQAEVAFVALSRASAGEASNSLDIPVVYPTTERDLRQITRWVRQGVYQAIEIGSTGVTARAMRSSSSGDRRWGTKFLVVAPLRSDAGKTWGAVAIVQTSPAIDLDTLHVVQRCAQTIASALAERDDLDADSAAPVPPVPPVPPARSRVHSGPREDFLLHELRVPLSAAAYALEALAQSHGRHWQYDDERLLYTAQSGVREAQAIVRSVSDWPALGAGVTMPQLTAVAVDEMVARALTLLPSARYRVRQDLDSDLPLVRGNESWILQVLVNLLENALNYSHAHSHIEVTGRRSSDDAVVIRVRSWSQALRPRRDWQASPEARRGLRDEPTSKGLGLNIARYFVSSLGGHIQIGGEGADEFTVTVTLPVA